jgi:TP901 family phage tail tape measure protein
MTDIRSDIIINVDTSIGIAEIKNLQRQIAELNAQLLKSGAQQAKAAQNIQRNLINNINSTGQFAANVRTISSTAESFTTALERNKLSMGEYFKYAGGASKTFGKVFRKEFDTIQQVAESRVKTLQTQYVKLGRDANGALKAISVRPLVLDMDNLATKTAIAAQKQQLFNQLLKQGSTNLLNFGKNTQWAGRQLMVGFSIPLAYIGTFAGKTFMKMEEQAIRFKRVYGDSFTASGETDKMVQQVQQLAKEFTKYGVAVEKTMEMAADAAAMGLMNADLLAQITQSTRLAVLGGVEQEQALETTISLMSAFGTTAKDLTKDIDFLNAVENQTITAIEDLTIAIPKAAPVIKQLGGNVQDLAFFLTAMKEGGINASEGANALKSGLASLINPSEKSAKFLENLGINIKGIVEGNAGDVKSTVIEFAQALDTLDPLNRARAIEQLFGKFQFSRLSTLFQNVVKEGTQAQRVLEITKNTTAELAILSERELKRVEDSPMYKLKKAFEDLKVSLVPLGEAFVKAITPIVEFAKGFLDRFNQMSDGAKQFAVIATTVVAGIGPILLMTFGLIANGVANLIKMFTAISGIFKGTGKSSVDLGNSTEYMTQQQLEAAAVAASLDQSHSKLIQTFGLESAAVDKLAIAYSRAVVAQSRLLNIPIGPKNPAGQKPMKLRTGIVSVPGPKGAGDIVPAMLSPGEAVIPAKQTEKYSGLIRGMINDDIPGFRFGRFGAASKGGGFMENALRMLTGQQRTASTSKLETKFAESALRRPGKKAAVRMFSDDLVAALGRGEQRYKNVFETRSQSRGSLDTAGGQRELAENKLFGFDSKTDPSKRPAYGYLFNKDLAQIRYGKKSLADKIFGADSTRGGINPRFYAQDRISEAMSVMNPKTYRYGDIAMILKNRSLRGRTTMTQGDSINASLNRFATPARLGTRSRESLRAAMPTGKGQRDFFEAQIMGGFSFKDIKRIVATEPGTILMLQQALKQAGLKGIKVGMPRYTMMQKLQNLVYGKKAKQPKMPRIQPATAGKYAGIYREDPMVLNGRTFWSEGGVPSKKDAQKPTSRSFNQDYALQAAHMSPAATLPDGNENFTAQQAIERIKKEYKDGISRGLLVDSPILRENLDRTIAAINQEAKEGRTFKLYGNNVGLMTASANQKVANKKSMKEASWFLEKLSLQSRGQLPASQLLTLIDGAKDLGLPGYTVSRTGIKTYAIATDNEYRRQLRKLGNVKIGEDELHRIYKLAGQKALGGFPDGPDKVALSRLTALGALNLTAGFAEPGESGATRPGKMSIFQKKMQEVAHSQRTALSEILGKGYRDDFFGVGGSKIQNITQEQKKAIDKLVAPIENDPQKRTEYMRLAKKIKAAFDKGPSELNKLLGLPDVAKPVASAEAEKIPKPKATPQKRQPEVFNASDIIARGARPSSQPKPKGFRRVFGFNSGVVSVPGPKGAGDVVPAMLSPGEAVIPTRMADKYAPLINGMISGNIPGYAKGKGKKGPSFGNKYTGTQSTASARTGTVLTETFPRQGVVSQRRVSPTVTQKELATLKKQLKGNPFKRAVNAITTNITGAIATGMQNANIAKVATKDYVAGYKERFKAEGEVIRRQEERMAKERAKRARAREGRLLAKERQSYKYELAQRGAAVKADGQLGYSAGQVRKGENVGGRFLPGRDATRILSASKAEYLNRSKMERIAKRQAAQEASRVKRMNKYSSSFAENNIKVAKDGTLRFAKTGVDKDGNAVRGGTPLSRAAAAQAIKDAKSQRRAERKEAYKANAAKIGAGASGLGMATMMYGMSGGPGADIAAMASIPLMLGPLIAPMLTNPIGIAVVALAAVAAVAYKLQEDLNNVRKEASKTAKAMSSGADAMQNLAEFAGTVSPTETMDKLRAEGRSGYDIVAGKTTFGGSFLESEDGKELLKQAQTSKTQIGGEASARLVAIQLSQAVASSVLTPGQAASIADNLGQAMKDYDFAVDVQAKMIELIGPNGEDLSKDPITVFANIIEERRGTVAGAGDAKDIIGDTSGNYGLLNLGRTNTTEVAAAEIEVAQLISDIVDMNQQNLDTLELEHIKRMETLKAAGDLAGMEEERNKYAQDRARLVEDGAKQLREEIKYISDLENSGTELLKKSAEQIVDNMENSLEAMFEGLDEKTKAASQLAVRDISDNTTLGLTFAEKASILAVVDVENMELYRQMLTLFDPKDKGNAGIWKKVAQLSVDMGPGTTEDMWSVLTGFSDTTSGKTKASQFVDYVVNLRTSGDVAGAENAISTMTELNKIKDDAGNKINLDSFVDDKGNVTEKFNNITTALDKLDVALQNAEGKKITVDILATTTGIQLTEQAQKYFDSLEPDQQKRYVTAYLTITESIDLNTDEGKARIEAWKKKKILEGGGSANTSLSTYYNNMSGADAAAAMGEEGGEQRTDPSRLAEDEKTTISPTTTKAPAAKEKDPYEDLLRDLKRVRNFTIDVTGGFKELQRVLGKGINMKALGGVESKLLESPEKISAPLASYFASLDKKTQDLYFTIGKDGKVILTQAGKLWRQAFDERAIGDVYVGLQGSLKTLRQQSSATKTLASYGLDWATATELAKDAELASAIASGKNAEEIRKIVKLKKEELSLIRQTAAANRIQENFAEGASLAQLAGFSLEEQKVISATQELQNLLKDGKGRDDATFRKLLAQEIAKTVYERQVAATNAVKEAIDDFKKSRNLDATIRSQLPQLGSVSVQTILNDPALMDLYRTGGEALGQSFYDRLNQLLSDPANLAKVFEAGLSSAFSAFDIQEKAVELKFQQDTKQFTDVEDGIIPKAERRIALIEDQVDDYEYMLESISSKEQEINEKYEARYKALELIQQVNQRLIDQQQSQLDIAGALSRGDISAAASAVQAYRAKVAQSQMENQKQALDLAKEKELNALTSEYNGKILTRKQIEKEVKDLKKQILEIQEKEVEPAERSLRLATDARDIAISNVSVLGLQRAEWEQIQNNVDKASINNAAFVTSLTAALSVTEALKKAYGELGGSTPGSVNVATTPAPGATAQFTTPTTEKPVVGPTLNPNSTGPTDVPVPGELNPPPAATPKELTETEKQVAELNRRIAITRWRVQNAKSLALKTSDVQELMRLNMDRIDEVKRLKGTVTGEAIKPGTPGYDKEIIKLAPGFASGGLIPKRFAVGGFAMGTDTVPAMLTPGEFVVRKYAVDNFGADNLRAINTGKYSGESVYNYEVNINVKSDANADQIARAVMTQIKQVDSQRIRGNKFNG